MLIFLCDEHARLPTPQFADFQQHPPIPAQLFVIKPVLSLAYIVFLLYLCTKFQNLHNMNTMNATIFLVAVANILLLIICIIGFRLQFLKRQLTDLRIAMFINKQEEMLRLQILIDQLKSQKSPRTIDNLQNLFADKIKHFRHQYPALTDTDIQVVTLIGLGIENVDILQLTGMSKRTYYKRRQLIAQRMNTNAANLDDTIHTVFTIHSKSL